MAYIVLLILYINSVLCDPGEPVVLVPSFDMRAANGVPVMAQFPATHFVPHPAHLQPIRPQTERDPDPQNLTFNDFIEAFNEVSQDEESQDDQLRAAGRDEAYSYSHPPSFPYPASPGYNPIPPLYHKPAYAPPAKDSAPKIPILKPGLVDLVKPVASKVQSKVNGLLGLVLALLTGSVPEGLELKGIKELLINSILKPLLAAKSGIKSLIGKLVIPVLALLLINVEVLVVVWWLWDECPSKIPTYSYKPASEYDSYK
ncbi:uncharacterized protein LOC115440754 [Manduca sexta]|uniref:uncharacterized protein LOC115440754 n=1 Tax=Manduca sexta TaxID=7130 RepID=UPI001183C4D2|nr:uncharacterized protein LOC115440754 [Manduca sexta]